MNKNKLNCEYCHKTGHVKDVCIQYKMKQRKDLKQTNKVTDSESEFSEDAADIHKVIDIYKKEEISKREIDKFYAKVLIEGKSQKFEVDSGAGYTLLPENDFNKLKLNVNLQKSNVAFRSYTGEIFLPKGVAKVTVEYKNNKSIVDLYVVSARHTPLLGRVWIRKLGIKLEDVDKQVKAKTLCNINSIESLVTKYPEVFEQKVGCIPNISCSLKLVPGAKPVFLRERRVPFALRDKVEEELDEWERDGIITKVNTSNWGSPLVVIPKPNGKVRLCVDYKIAVNPQLEPAHYPITRVDKILNTLKDCKYFCKLDLYKAYLHVKVDEESKNIQTISTHRGTYRMNRLAFGVKTAPSEFNCILDQILRDLPGTSSYFDDIIVFAKTKQECEEMLTKCLDKLKEYNLHVNRDKCQFYRERIQYLGYTIEYNKITKCPEKVKAIRDIPTPKRPDDLRRFLGMITYYSRFIPDLSTITYPLRKLLSKNTKFKWSEECQSSFERLKREILTDRVLRPYDADLPVVLTCDASPTGIAAVLAHEENGVERPVSFISRALTKAEQNYSQLDREALAIIFAVGKFFQYLYAREFTLVTDNRPLSRILHQSEKIPAMTSARLLRYASFLQGFNYKMKHRKSELITHVDCLSRAPAKDSSNRFTYFLDEEVNAIQIETVNTISTNIVRAISIAKETGNDPELAELRTKLINGKIQDPEYTIQSDIVLKGQRVMIPKSLRGEILKELHYTHLGIVKMKQMARRYCYWKGMDADIENLVKSCHDCAMVR
ncbi:PREDICTED: uncharacterized protein K02A2.6-like [Rhagoletis zephyria]|uniref:uncharacterized protein K02A2.6-like n=1 Tax=Rhagoletis zephyria TaxID=28612 RepID=UPI00081157CC|nr:PREDICTED: uncharacterized protein K02A2.6-like [Rhagoletis zephyria]